MEKKKVVENKKKENKETYKLDMKTVIDISFDMVKTSMNMVQRERKEKQVWQVLAMLCAVGTALLVIFTI